MSKRIRQGSPKVAIGYLRVSTDEQRLGPAAQRAAIEAWAASAGASVVAWYADQGVSGAAPVEQRSGLTAALGALRGQGAGVLVVAKRDRIARDVVVAAMVERLAEAGGARVVSAGGEGNGDAPADQFMRGVIDCAAQYERGLIRARTKAALGAKRARGERVGGIPYGWALARDGVRLESVAQEQATIARAWALREQGISLRTIATALAAEGRVSRTGRPFQATQIARMTEQNGEARAA